ncbi:MAG: hypothetical protein OHK0029_32080 [Armatimonadaceae bacterium]
MSKSYSYSSDATLREAATIALNEALCRMSEHTEATHAGLSERNPTPEGIEALHDMRVGSRRVRAALSVFGGIFSADERENLTSAAKQITDALGTVRDLDVQIEMLERYKTTVSAAQVYGIERLIEQQKKTRNKKRKALLSEWSEIAPEKFARRLQKALSKSGAESREGTRG